MKKTISMIMLSLLCISNLGMAFADSAIQPVPVLAVSEASPAVPTLYNDESAPVPTLYNEPVLYEEASPVLISAINKPVVTDNVVYLPLREIAERMAFDVKWNSKDRSIDIMKENSTSKMYVDNTQFSINKSLGQFEKNPKVIDGTTFLAQADIENLLGIVTTVDGNDILLKSSAETSVEAEDVYNYTGTIKDLKFGEHGPTVLLEGGNADDMIDDLVVNIHFETEIENGSFKDFKIGTVLDVQYSISTRSIPAQTNAEKIRVAKTQELYSTYKGTVKEVTEDDKGFTIRLAKDDNEMNDLIVHIQQGSFMASELYELDGKTMTVEYTIATMSIPAQTSPIKILVAR